MLVAVTGATGFLGRLLVERLLARGDEVRCLVRKPEASLPDGALPVVGDLERDLAPLVRGAELVFHCAAATRKQAASVEAMWRVNQQGTAHLVAACKRVAPDLRRFVLASSIAAVGPARGGASIDEDAEPRPLSIYGQTKLAAEREVRGVPYALVRLPGLYGPRDASLLPLFKAVRLRLRPSSARQMPLLHVSCAADALLLAATAPGALDRVLHAAGAPLTATECGLAVAAALGVRALPVPLATPLVWLVDRERARELGADWRVDSQRLRALGWSQRISFAAGARALLLEYRAAGLL